MQPRKNSISRWLAVSTLVAGAVVAGLIFLPRDPAIETSPSRQDPAPTNPAADLRAVVDRLSIQGVVQVQGKFAIVAAGKTIRVGQPIDADSGIVVASVEHSAVVGGPPSRVVVWFESKQGLRVSRELASRVMLR